MTVKNTKITGYTAAIISVILLGPMGIFVRNISANEYIITFARLGLGLVFLCLLLWIRKSLKQTATIKVSFPLVSTGILMAMAILCYTKAINSTSLANAVFLLYLGPLIAVGIAALFLKEKFTFINGCLLGLAFIGFLFLLEFNVSPDINESKGYLGE